MKIIENNINSEKIRFVAEKVTEKDLESLANSLNFEKIRFENERFEHEKSDDSPYPNNPLIALLNPKKEELVRAFKETEEFANKIVTQFLAYQKSFLDKTGYLLHLKGQEKNLTFLSQSYIEKKKGHFLEGQLVCETSLHAPMILEALPENKHLLSEMRTPIEIINPIRFYAGTLGYKHRSPHLRLDGRESLNIEDAMTHFLNKYLILIDTKE